MSEIFQMLLHTDASITDEGSEKDINVQASSGETLCVVCLSKTQIGPSIRQMYFHFLSY